MLLLLCCAILDALLAFMQLDDSLEANPYIAAQGGGSLMQAALQCTGDGWCGWGLPVTPGKMVGASAVIVKTCPTCPSGAQQGRRMWSAPSLTAPAKCRNLQKSCMSSFGPYGPQLHSLQSESLQQHASIC